MNTTPTDKSYFGYKVTTPEITLRDYFAAAALTGMYAGYQGNAPEPEQVAEDAYFIADEMLKERNK